MNRSESIGNLAAALAKAQKAIKGALKDKKNSHFGSAYADLASVVEASEPLSENEISYLQSGSVPEAGLVRMVTMLAHSSGEWIESDPLTVQAKDAGPQAVGSCLTYLRRYQLAALVGIAPEDDDAEAGEGRAVGSQPAARPQVPKPLGPPTRVQPPATARPVANSKPATVDERGNPLNASDIPF